MTKQFKAVILCAVVAFSLTGSAHAQFTASIKTNTINGVHSNWVGSAYYIVGSNTFKDVLQIINGGVLTFTDPGGATNTPSRFYQVDVIWPPE